MPGRPRSTMFGAAVAVLALFGAAAPAATAAPAGGGAAVGPLQVADAKTRVAHTASGEVGYREFGAGSPVLLVMGLGGSMDAWPPGFLAALARGHRVVVFDNAGVGRTAALASPLSITEMANETSELISALGLGRTAVLGWSMGGMIAQALAVVHPAQLSKIILAATQAGTGRALPVPRAAAAAAASSDPLRVLSVLFPPTAVPAARAYALAVAGYPDLYQAPRATVMAQATAVEEWLAGKQPVGARFGRTRLPTLVADGTLDALDPSTNARMLADSVHGAKLALYPGAGHAFLFQDEPQFLGLVRQFLGAHFPAAKTEGNAAVR